MIIHRSKPHVEGNGFFSEKKLELINADHTGMNFNIDIIFRKRTEKGRCDSDLRN
jgi:hypothetical protein